MDIHSNPALLGHGDAIFVGFQLRDCMGTSNTWAPFFITLGYVTPLSCLASYLCAIIPRKLVVALVLPHLRTSSSTLGAVNITNVWS